MVSNLRWSGLARFFGLQFSQPEARRLQALANWIDMIFLLDGTENDYSAGINVENWELNIKQFVRDIG